MILVLIFQLNSRKLKYQYLFEFAKVINVYHVL